MHQPIQVTIPHLLPCQLIIKNSIRKVSIREARTQRIIEERISASQKVVGSVAAARTTTSKEENNATDARKLRLVVKTLKVYQNTCSLLSRPKKKSEQTEELSVRKVL